MSHGHVFRRVQICVHDSASLIDPTYTPADAFFEDRLEVVILCTTVVHSFAWQENWSNRRVPSSVFLHSGVVQVLQKGILFTINIH